MGALHAVLARNHVLYPSRYIQSSRGKKGFYFLSVLGRHHILLQVKTILGSLNMFLLSKESRKSEQGSLTNYFVETMGYHDFWSIKVILAHSLYLLNVVGQVFFTDCFLGYEFSKYGVSAATLLEQESETRTDPMSRVFPRVTKCTFHKYGPSGSIQVRIFDIFGSI